LKNEKQYGVKPSLRKILLPWFKSDASRFRFGGTLDGHEDASKIVTVGQQRSVCGVLQVESP
jgi:hypothetical protein